MGSIYDKLNRYRYKSIFIDIYNYGLYTFNNQCQLCCVQNYKYRSINIELYNTIFIDNEGNTHQKIKVHNTISLDITIPKFGSTTKGTTGNK